MSRVSNSSIAAGALALLVIALLVVRGARVETEIGPTVTVDPGTLGSDSGAVIGHLQTGGFSLLGVEFGRKTHSVDVLITAPPGCAAAVADGEAWPTSLPDCRPSLDIVGAIVGRGTAATGQSTIVVRVEVDRTCFEATQPGDTWPSPACG